MRIGLLYAPLGCFLQKFPTFTDVSTITGKQRNLRGFKTTSKPLFMGERRPKFLLGNRGEIDNRGRKSVNFRPRFSN